MLNWSPVRILRTAITAFILFIRYNKIYVCSAAGIILVAVALTLVFNTQHKALAFLETQIPAMLSDPAGVAIKTDPIGHVELGSGMLKPAGNSDLSYKVQPEENLSEIAYLFGLEEKYLAFYNKLPANPKLRAGQIIVIPSERNLETIKQNANQTALASPTYATVTQMSSGKVKDNLEITAKLQHDGTAITAHFTIADKLDDTDVRYEWDLGNGYKAFKKDAFCTYRSSGTYTIALKIINSAGEVKESNKLFIDVPHTATIKSANQFFITLRKPGEIFSIRGEIIEINGTREFEDTAELIERSSRESFYKALKAGSFHVVSKSEIEEFDTYIFVSPMDSVHSDRQDINWYRTQFNSGTISNCGPTVVSMGIGWALGKYVSVSEVRGQIGWEGDGSTSFEDLITTLARNDVTAYLKSVNSVDDICDLIDRNKIAIILYFTGGITSVKGDPGEDLVGQYYIDAVGHYIIIKGYSKDKDYFVVYDPIPSDWATNSKRYDDGISMIGRNRYYPAKELFDSLRRKEIIVLSQK